MRNRARPAAVFSLIGIASRIAERMGLHRDGDDLGLPVLRSEERRRMWWQLQHMEIAIAQLVGCITMTIYADWDTKLPKNLEDHDLRPDIQALPPDRHGLTTMSHCLWRYQLLYMQRTMRQPDGSRMGLSWMLSPRVPLVDKDAMIDTCEKALSEQFLQHCELLNPLHVHIQIGVRSFILAARRVARQPALINAKISEMSLREREDFLGICTKCLEYYVLSKKTETLRGFQWHNENYFQWAACE
jgi:Fungal specific transcription factor domain